MCRIGHKSSKGRPKYIAADGRPGAREKLQPNMVGTHGQTSIGGDLPGPAPHTAGPHRHDILNKLDPTVDSRSGGAQILGPGVDTSTRAYEASYGPGVTSNAGPGVNPAVTSSMTTYSAPPPGASATAPMENVSAGARGPHSSRLANAIDPRVDSNTGSDAAHTDDRHAVPVHGAEPMATTQGEMYGTQQGWPTSTLRPRADLDPNLQGSATAQAQIPRAVHVGGTQPGPAPHTAGPHRN
ncbi:uncharacterized protein MAM_00504 [Metarhizium album ARSEF 1941]|uniref:Uncharacterized protein n=1 Tax=Metarhizium album (strain ARSEF 1941) TaxID=1081103 RepID=A0A0B2X6W0_METAS|nr:uncharacterized protein MAM_00504 [Metarhizium album ARSEF 1941]KHO01503.1 hypothetical protein MAM_00504 [Metarhizium album ARSEF 1941]